MDNWTTGYTRRKVRNAQGVERSLSRNISALTVPPKHLCSTFVSSVALGMAAAADGRSLARSLGPPLGSRVKYFNNAMKPRGWIPLTWVIPWLLTKHHEQVRIVPFPSEIYITVNLQDGSAAKFCRRSWFQDNVPLRPVIYPLVNLFQNRLQ